MGAIQLVCDTFLSAGRSVLLADPSLQGFVSAGFDDHLKFILPGADGQPVMRDYTPAAFDTAAGTLVLEFALHGSGAASDWARQAQPGQIAQRRIVGLRGSPELVEHGGDDGHAVVLQKYQHLGPRESLKIALLEVAKEWKFELYCYTDQTKLPEKKQVFWSRWFGPKQATHHQTHPSYLVSSPAGVFEPWALSLLETVEDLLS